MARSLGEKLPGSSKYQSYEYMDLYLHSQIRLHGVALKYRDNFNFTLHK
jgi:hypothetical protein